MRETFLFEIGALHCVFSSINTTNIQKTFKITDGVTKHNINKHSKSSGKGPSLPFGR